MMPAGLRRWIASAPPTRLVVAGLALVLVWVTALLLLNPGYFSHDELQWAAFAARPWAAMPWQDPLQVGAYQYRPLTFNLWLLLSRWLFDWPWAMHLAWVLLGVGNGVLLHAVLRRLELPAPVALLGALLFLVSPYAVYVHGWVATLADILWVGIGLALLCWLLGRDAPRSRGDVLALVLAGALASTIALLCKEAALSIAALLVVAAAATRQARYGWAALGASLVACVYLVLRASVVLGASEQATGYGWSLGSVPLRWAGYHLFPFHLHLVEAQSIMSQRVLLQVAAVVLCVLGYLFAFGSLRRLGWMLVASAAALGPVLLLDSAASQYGYGLAALLAGVLAACWHHHGAVARWAVLAIAVFWAAHGVRVAHGLYRVGAIQAGFSPAVAALVATRQDPLVLHAECPADAWIYRRLLHEIPSYGGIPIGTRARFAPEPEPGSLAITCNGKVPNQHDNP